MPTLTLLGALLLVGAAAFFSAAETAVLASDRFALRRRAALGDERVRPVLRFLERPDAFVTSILFGNNLALVAATTLVTVGVADAGWKAGGTAAAVAATGLLLIFADVVPKAVALTDPAYFATAFAPAVAAAEWLFKAPVATVNALAGGFFKRARVRAERLPLVTREELRAILTDGRAETVADVVERRMIKRIFRFGETTVAKVMTPAERVEALPADAAREDVTAAFVKTGYSRYPVYEGARGRVVGAAVARDFLTLPAGAAVRDFLKPVLDTTADMSIEDVLPRLADHPTGLAVVRDAEGMMTGIVTAEDILEEVVGEIEDEFSWGDAGLVKSARGYVVDGRLAVAHFNRRMPAALPEADYATVAGFLTKRLGRVPSRGDVVRWGPYTFRVLRTTPRAARLIDVEVSTSGLADR